MAKKSIGRIPKILLLIIYSIIIINLLQLCLRILTFITNYRIAVQYPWAFKIDNIIDGNFCSGGFIKLRNNIIYGVTAKHCITNATVITIISDQITGQYPIKILNNNIDLAVITNIPQNVPHIACTTNNVIFLGFYSFSGMYGISNLLGLKELQSMHFMLGHLNSGESGSIIIDSNQCAVGVISMYIPKYVLSIATPINYLNQYELK